MSSAANHKRDELEEAFQARLHGGEAKPSPDLWSRIDHELTVRESAEYKRGMVWYRQLAAACLVILLAAGSVFVYHLKNERSTAVKPLATVATDNTMEQRIAAVQPEATPVSPETAVVSKPSMASVARSVPAKKPFQSAAEANAAEPVRIQANLAIAEVPALQTELPNVAVQQQVLVYQPSYAYTSIPPQLQLQATKGKNISTGIFASSAGGAFTETDVKEQRHRTSASFLLTARQAMLAAPSTPGEARHYAAKQLFYNTDAAGQLPESFRELSNSASARRPGAQAQQQAITLFALDNVKPNTGNKPSVKEEKPTEQGRWIIGMAYTPSYFDQNIGIPEQMASPRPAGKMGIMNNPLPTSSETAYNIQEAQDEFEQNTDPAFSFAVDARAGVRVGKKWKLFSGLGFTQNTARTKSSYIIKQFWLKPRTNEKEQLNSSSVFLPSLSGNFFTDSVSVSKTNDFYVNYRYRHLSIPVGAQYEGNINKNWRWYIAGSVAANILLETSVLASNNEVKDVHYTRADHSPFRKMQFSGNVSSGIAKRLTDNISVSAGPELRGYFDTMLSDTEKALAPQGRPYTAG